MKIITFPLKFTTMINKRRFSMSKSRTVNRMSFWFVAYALLIIMMGTNIPAPLYSLYGQLWHFSTGVTSFLFIMYVLFLIPASFVFGQLSDRIGRKKVLLAGVIAAGAGSLMFSVSHNLAMLLASRAIQGVGVGIINGTAVATLSELRPANSKTASLVASVSIAIGTAIGPLYSGLLGEYSSSPIRLPYYLHLVLLGIAFLGLLAVPETHKIADAPQSLKLPSVPAVIRKPFTISVLASIIAWAVAVFFMTLVPTVIATQMNLHNLALSGAVVCLMLGFSTLSQILFKSLSASSAIYTGFALLTLGIVGVVIAIPTHSVFLLLLSTVLAGSGHGPAASGSMSWINEMSPSGSRADMMSIFYAVTYLGAGIPVLALGIGAEWIGFYQAISIYSGLIVVFAAVVALIVRGYHARA
ncbi:MFS transporter [Paenibacillus favisporus]|uniref:MFS transporter n=1 Tax=Paenibacillus favisporus TaxID=221028 RepID=UPI003D279CDD